MGAPASGAAAVSAAEREGTKLENLAWRNRDELLRFADLTLVEFLRHNARYGQGSKVVEEDGLVLFAGPHPHPNPYRSGVFRTDNRLPAVEALDRAHGFFAGLNRSYVVWVREKDPELDEVCRSRAMRLLEPDGLSEMVLEQAPPEVKAPPEGVVVTRVADEATRSDYLHVVAEGWGMPGTPLDVAAGIFFDPDSVDVPNMIAFVAYVDGKPASGAMTFLSHGIAFGGQGATVPWARRRGLAELCYGAALWAAYDEWNVRGSVCQSSPSGAGVWGAMGYRAFTKYMRYVGQPTAAWE